MYVMYECHLLTAKAANLAYDSHSYESTIHLLNVKLGQDSCSCPILYDRVRPPKVIGVGSQLVK